MDFPSPQQLKHMSADEINRLIPAIRQRITQVVSQTGGHLGSNLGVVELTVALHRVLDTPNDRIIFDVGHQCYAHKILTGRNEQMESLRTFGGLSGFPKCSESVYDCYETGHASTALSAAVGMARARDLQGDDYHVVAVVGDGALTGGMCYEALNDLGSNKTPLLIILNDNQMSISPNLSALSEHLSNLRTSKGWLGFKRGMASAIHRLPRQGKKTYSLLRRMRDQLRNLFVHDNFFSSLGIRYYGPFDGQDEPLLEKMISRALGMNEPILLHVVTTKGAGYIPAEQEPENMHGVVPFDLESGIPHHQGAEGFGHRLGFELTQLAKKDKRLVVISAAMVSGTGMSEFARAFPERLFDVGIAEEHAVTMAAGMAKGGLLPVVAIYDTFMQRACDQVIEDVCLQDTHVVFLMDRGGLGGQDGPTHQGVFSGNIFFSIPNLIILSPRNDEQAVKMLSWALYDNQHPVMIRYPKQQGKENLKYPVSDFRLGQWEKLEDGQNLTLVAQGSMVDTAINVKQILSQAGYHAGIVHANTFKPLDEIFLKNNQNPIVVIEEQQHLGGLFSAITSWCVENCLVLPVKGYGLPDSFIEHGSRDDLLNSLHLNADSIAKSILRLLEGK
ncbi:MAG: 1-deoxy-D-xylulose-5-phosphate synthase [Christensenellales bacterium]|jgi:1-deoxy-D-xylulose-5-phosphate synthase